MRIISLFVAAALSCSGQDIDLGVDRTTAVRVDPILGGAADTTHSAVVLIRSALTARGYGECSGTVISTDLDAGTAWVLTAAHCLADWRPSLVLVGADPNASQVRQYAVLDSFRAPDAGRNTEDARDLALVRIVGVDSTVPVIAVALADDGLAVGSAVKSLGYGVTVNDGDDPQPQLRRVISRSLSAVGSPFIRYTSSDGVGVCSGDSGGPVLFGSDGQERVVGVHAYVDPDCLGAATSMRVANQLEFISSVSATPTPPINTCALCSRVAESGNNVCALRRDACAADVDCRAINTCRSRCGSQACADDCVASNTKGAGLWLAFQRCSCLDVCPALCASNSFCQGLLKCGPAAAGACDSCGESACCAERAAAANDKIGYQCLISPSADACIENLAYQAYVACRARACVNECPAPVFDAGVPTAVDAGILAMLDAGVLAEVDAGTNVVDPPKGGGCGTVPGELVGLIGLCVFLLRRRRASRETLSE